MNTGTIEAPTDAQLSYIYDLCGRHNLGRPDAVASRQQEASEIIDQIRAGNYDPERYAYPWGVPFR